MPENKFTMYRAVFFCTKNIKNLCTSPFFPIWYILITCETYKKVQIFFCNGLKNFAIGKKTLLPGDSWAEVFGADNYVTAIHDYCCKSYWICFCKLFPSKNSRKKDSGLEVTDWVKKTSSEFSPRTYKSTSSVLSSYASKNKFMD